MQSIIIKNGRIVNKGKIKEADIFIRNGFIEKIGKNISTPAEREIDAAGMVVMPGIIDDQVHFREPGMTHKANIYTESRAAVMGGVTSFMEMPNTKPSATTQELLEDKYKIASNTSLANYSFYMGASNDNLEEVLKTDPEWVCGIKAFMGSSTGNMLVDDLVTLEKLFSETDMLIATHCEDEATIRYNTELYKKQYGEDIPIGAHPIIRSAESCYLSSSLAVKLAKKHNTRLHILHLTTAGEMELFDNTIPLKNKRITAEVCVHHLYFNADDYDRLGAKIKCNPAVKTENDRKALWEALLNDKLDVIATDHAPHTKEEKNNKYLKAPSGLPLVQHTLNIMLTFVRRGEISLEKVVEKMCHAPADCFNIERRGYLEEGYWADIVIVDPDQVMEVKEEDVLYKCGWTPLAREKLYGNIDTVIVSGHIAMKKGRLFDNKMGERLRFVKS